MWSTVSKTFDIVKDVTNLCFYSYFSVMDDLRQEGPPNGKYYEIRFMSLYFSLSLYFVILSCL